MRLILFRLLDPYIEKRTISRALEAGCGVGYLSRLLQAKRKLPIIPMDLSAEGLRFGRQMGLERALQGNIVDLPFGAGVFDLVISIDVMQQLQHGDERRAAAEFARVLRPGGLLALRVSALDILRSRHSEFVFEKQRYTRERLMRVFSEVGVRTLRCVYANSLLMPVALAKFRIWEPLIRKAPSTGVESAPPWLDRLLFGALAWESAWVAKGHDLPLGQSLFLIGERAAA